MNQVTPLPQGGLVRRMEPEPTNHHELHFSTLSAGVDVRKYKQPDALHDRRGLPGNHDFIPSNGMRAGELVFNHRDIYFVYYQEETVEGETLSIFKTYCHSSLCADAYVNQVGMPDYLDRGDREKIMTTNANHVLSNYGHIIRRMRVRLQQIYDGEVTECQTILQLAQAPTPVS